MLSLISTLRYLQCSTGTWLMCNKWYLAASHVSTSQWIHWHFSSMTKTQHMFSFKACHYLPAFFFFFFFFGYRFSSTTCMSSPWQCSPLAITLENSESAWLLLFCFSSPSERQLWAACKSRLSQEAWLWPSLMVGARRSPKPHAHVAQLSFSWQHKVRNGEELHPKRDGVGVIFLPSPSQEGFQDTTGCRCRPKPQRYIGQSSSPLRAGLLLRLVGAGLSSLKLISPRLGWGGRWAKWWGMWKKLSNRSVTAAPQESASESESDVNGATGRHKSSLSQHTSGLDNIFTGCLHRLSRNTFFTCSFSFFFSLWKYWRFAAYKQFFKQFHVESNEWGQKSLLSPVAAGLKIHFCIITKE